VTGNVNRAVGRPWYSTDWLFVGVASGTMPLFSSMDATPGAVVTGWPARQVHGCGLRPGRL
jgi:hypothetical protein